jgi:hypothetical protein
MNNELYYTPDLDEFFIGFEYEWKDENGVWNKAVPTEITVEGYEEQTYGLRVKYLDKEDIESLGFVKTKYTSEYRCFQLLFDDRDDEFYELEFYCEDYNNEIWIEKFTQSGIDNNGVDYNSSYIFKGKIKNKSELIKLLKQLNIQ